MFPSPHRPPARQRGSMLIISLFVIIVLALLGLTMTRMIAASSQATIVEVSGLRALTAAQSGAQLLLQQTFPLSAPINQCNTTVDSSVDFPGLSAIPGLESCRFIANCNTQPVTKGGEIHNYYRFSSTGQCEIGDIIVTRQVSLDAMQVQP